MIPALQAFVDNNHIDDRMLYVLYKELCADVATAKSIVDMIPKNISNRLNIGVISDDGTLETANAICTIRQAQKRLRAAGCKPIGVDPISILILNNCTITYLCPVGHINYVPLEDCCQWSRLLCKQCALCRRLKAKRVPITLL